MRRTIKTKEIESRIVSIIKCSVYSNELKSLLDSLYFFTDKIKFPGVYIYSDKNSYHCIYIGDRGSVDRVDEQLELDLVIKEVIWGLVSSLSIKFPNDTKGDNFRKKMFGNRMELASSLADDYKDYVEDKIIAILEESPYE